MSGGHWGQERERYFDASCLAGDGLDLLAELHRVMDYAFSGDSCDGCARLTVFEVLEAFYDQHACEHPADWKETLAGARGRKCEHRG